MKHYKQTHSFTLDDELKSYLTQLKKNGVNVSKFIRESIEKNKPTPIKTKKYTMNGLKESLNEILFNL